MNVCVNHYHLSSMQVPPPPPTTEEKALAALREVLGASFDWLVSFDAPAEKVEPQYTEAFSKLSMDGLEAGKERPPLRVDIILPRHLSVIKELEKRSDYQEIAGAAQAMLEPYYKGQSPRKYDFNTTIGNQAFNVNVRDDAGYYGHLAVQRNNKPSADSVSLDPCVIINQRPHMGWDYAVLQAHFGRCCELSHAIDAIEEKTQAPFVEEVRWDKDEVASINKFGQLTIGEPSTELAECIGSEYWEWLLAHEQDHYIKGDVQFNISNLIFGEMSAVFKAIELKKYIRSPRACAASLLEQMPDLGAVKQFIFDMDEVLTGAQEALQLALDHAMEYPGFLELDRYHIIDLMAQGDNLAEYFEQAPRMSLEQSSNLLHKLEAVKESDVPFVNSSIKGSAYQEAADLLIALSEKHSATFDNPLQNFFREYAYAKELRCDMRVIELADDPDRAVEIRDQYNEILSHRAFRKAIESVGVTAEEFNTLPDNERIQLAEKTGAYKDEDVPINITYDELSDAIRLHTSITRENFVGSTHPSDQERAEFMADYAGGLQDALAERGLTWAERMQPSSKTEVGDPASRIQSGNPQQHSR